MRKQVGEMLNDFRDQLTGLLFPEIESLNENPIQFEYDEGLSHEYVKSSHLLLTTNLQLVETHAMFLADHHNWNFVQNKTAQSFFTSDSPTILDSTVNVSPLFGITFNSSGARVLFPVNPKLLIWTNQRDQQTEPILRQITNELQINNMNAAQVINSERWIYSLDGNFSFIKEMKVTEQNSDK